AHRGPHDGNLVAGRHDLEQTALQRAHAHHVLQVNVQPLDVDEPRVVPGEIEFARTLEVNAGGGGGGQRAVPALHKVRAALVACLGFGEHLVGLHIEEPAAHARVAHNAFQVTHAAATAVPLLGVER